MQKVYLRLGVFVDQSSKLGSEMTIGRGMSRKSPRPQGTRSLFNDRGVDVAQHGRCYHIGIGECEVLRYRSAIIKVSSDSKKGKTKKFSYAMSSCS